MKNDCKFMNLTIEEIQLDMNNPRIAKFIEMYDKDALNSEQLALALGSGVEDSSQTNYSSLYNSIKTNKGIIHPIIVNHQEEDKYIVIEGNTRVQIYKEFKENNVEGDWNSIPSMVYENLSESEIHAIRLQSHLVGPREWDPYSKAKYLNFLSNEQNLPMTQIIDFCGGKKSEIMKLINAYQDMEKHYRPLLEADDEFDQRDFSKFLELQNSNIKQALLAKFSLNDFAKWVIDGNVDAAINVRRLPEILKNEEATKILLKSNIKTALEKVITDKPEYKDISGISIEQLCIELIKKMNEMPFQEYNTIRNGNNPIKDSLIDLRGNIDIFVEDISRD